MHALPLPHPFISHRPSVHLFSSVRQILCLPAALTHQLVSSIEVQREIAQCCMSCLFGSGTLMELAITSTTLTPSWS
jgi:hypothetical protein